MLLSILIVSYNTRQMTLNCLRSVYAQTQGTDLEVMVLDNASSDGSAQAVSEQFPGVHLIAGEDNIGFARANNAAAREAKGQYLLLLNPDTVVLDGAIGKLLSFADSHGGDGVYGGRTLNGDMTLNPWSCWRKATPWSALCMALGLTAAMPKSDIFARESYGSWKRDCIREVDIVSGCFLLIKRSLWEKLGGFDESFFMYGEEADLCLRAGAEGHRCVIFPEATIIHYGGASESVRAGQMVKLFRAKAQLNRKHWHRLWRRTASVYFDVWAAIRLIVFGVGSLLREDWRPKAATWRAVWRNRKEWHSATGSPV